MQKQQYKKRLPSIFLFTVFVIVFHVDIPVSQAQNKDKATVGIAQWASSSDYERNIQGFKEGLREAGYEEGKNIKYIIKNPEGDFDAQVKIIEAFVKERVDLIYSLTTPGTLAAKSVTKDVPIVFSIVTYPVEAGVVDSLDSSGNNLTGTTNYVPASRQYFFFEKIFPGTKKLAFVHHKGEPNSQIQYEQFKEYLDKRKIAIVDIAAIDLEDMRQKLESNIGTVDATYSACDTLIQSGGAEVMGEVSKKYKKPSFTCLEDGVLKGAVMGDVADVYAIGKISGKKAALILQGIEPARIQIESPQGDNLIINKKVAKELGLTISPYILEKAKKVVE